MSALLQSPNLYRSLRGLNEFEAITLISRLGLAAADAASGLASLAGVTLRLGGLHGVEASLRSSMKFADTLQWHDSQAPAPCGSASGLVSANGREWGRIRINFEPRVQSVECPLRFARVLAQHAALMLNRLELVDRNEASTAAVSRLQDRLETRKAVSRAAGLLARSQHLSERKALSLLLEQARQSRRPLLQLARSIILGQQTGHFKPISLRRLGPEELTATC
jgi:ANTAR domain